jgi:hypothetical protein
MVRDMAARGWDALKWCLCGTAMEQWMLPAVRIPCTMRVAQAGENAPQVAVRAQTWARLAWYVLFQYIQFVRQ